MIAGKSSCLGSFLKKTSKVSSVGPGSTPYVTCRAVTLSCIALRFPYSKHKNAQLPPGWFLPEIQEMEKEQICALQSKRQVQIAHRYGFRRKTLQSCALGPAPQADLSEPCYPSLPRAGTHTYQFQFCRYFAPSGPRATREYFIRSWGVHA